MSSVEELRSSPASGLKTLSILILRVLGNLTEPEGFYGRWALATITSKFSPSHPRISLFSILRKSKNPGKFFFNKSSLMQR
jgi:hypothetical protein